MPFLSSSCSALATAFSSPELIALISTATPPPAVIALVAAASTRSRLGMSTPWLAAKLSDCVSPSASAAATTLGSPAMMPLTTSLPEESATFSPWSTYFCTSDGTPAVPSSCDTTPAAALAASSAPPLPPAQSTSAVASVAPLSTSPSICVPWSPPTFWSTRSLVAVASAEIASLARSTSAAWIAFLRSSGSLMANALPSTATLPLVVIACAVYFWMLARSGMSVKLPAIDRLLLTASASAAAMSFGLPDCMPLTTLPPLSTTDRPESTQLAISGGICETCLSVAEMVLATISPMLCASAPVITAPATSKAPLCRTLTASMPSLTYCSTSPPGASASTPLTPSSVVEMPLERVESCLAFSAFSSTVLVYSSIRLP